MSSGQWDAGRSSVLSFREPLKERELLLSFPHSRPAHRSADIVAGLGTVILEHKVTLEAEATWTEQDRRKLFLNVGSGEKHLSCLKRCYFGFTVTPGQAYF